MPYLLDTNACVRYLNAKAPALCQRVNQAGPGQILVSAVVKAELYYGASKSVAPERTLAAQRFFLSRFASVPFDDLAAEEHAAIRSALEARGTPIGANDLLIASIALANELTLVTHNVGEFARVPRLKFEDWETS